MSLLRELRARASRPRRSFAGTVVSVSGDSVVIESRAGRTVALKGAALTLGAGDEVLVSAEGNVLGRVKRAAEVPVYRL